MARNTYENWIPVEYSSEALRSIRTPSAVEAVATPVQMGSDTKKVARAQGGAPAAIGKGAAYPENVNTDDTVLLDSVKLGGAVRIAEEDIEDSFIPIVDSETVEYVKNRNVFIDNAVLATTAAGNGTTVPFTSVYKAVRTADATVGYTADANYIASAGAVTYDKLSALFAINEAGLHYGNQVLIAHPAFKSVLRGVKDGEGRPIFLQGLAGTPDTLFGADVLWSQGARTSATATAFPAGNPLLIAGNADYLLYGKRIPLQTTFIDPRSGVGALTDEGILKFRERTAFTLGDPSAFAVLEVTAS